MNSSCSLGSVQVENSKLKLENILSKNCIIFFLLISAKIILSILQQYRCHGNSGCPIGLVCIIFLLTGLRIYTGEYKAQGPT